MGKRKRKGGQGGNDFDEKLEVQLELERLRLQQINFKGTFASPSKKASTLSLPPTPTDSAIKESRTPLSRLKEFVAELSSCSSISLLVNGGEVIPAAIGRWVGIVNDSSVMDKNSVRALLQIPAEFDLSEGDEQTHGLVHNSQELYDMGETAYQKRINEASASKLCFLVQTHKSSSLIPAAKQHDNGIFRFSGKADILSALRPMAVEIKGVSHTAPYSKPFGSKHLDNVHCDVLEQALRRVYSVSCIQQYMANIAVFAVCSDRAWLAWYQRKMVQEELRQQESINMIEIEPSSLGYYWALLTKQALENRNVMFLEGHDAMYLIDFLDGLQPHAAHYCRTRFITMSMNSVYAVTLPQREAEKGESLCISKSVKHFALKVIQNQQQFEQEAQCIAQINGYIHSHGYGIGEGCNSTFYALGSKKWGEECKIHNSRAFDTSKIGSLLGEIMRPALEAHEQRMRDDVVPWWLYVPKPDKPLAGGVILMLCGDYNHKVSASNRVLAYRGVSYWLDLIHSAGVLHRDIRRSNIMRFDRPVRYTAVIPKEKKSGKEAHEQKGDGEAGDYKDELTKDEQKEDGKEGEQKGDGDKKGDGKAPDDCLPWQLIDFNLGYCFTENIKEQSGAVTAVHVESSQYKNAGLTLHSTINKANGEWMNYMWTYRDDREMLGELFVQLF
eukprot:gene26993-32612_t